MPDPECHKRRPDALTVAAFALLVVALAANPLAVRFTDRGLPPFWGGGTRMAGGALVFFIYLLIRRIPLPRGRGLRQAMLFGFVQFGLGFGLGYWALVKMTAGVAGVMLAFLPLFTLIVAALARIEPMTVRGVVGSLVSVAGIAVMLGGRAGSGIPLTHIAAMLGFVACLAGGLVIAKAARDVSPAALNAIGMLVGAAVLLLTSAALGESRSLPTVNATWAVQLYVILVGSVGVFSLILFVLHRWTASATSYQTVLSPPITILLAAWLLGEPISQSLLLGAIIVALGVYVGVISHWGPPRRASHSPAG